jgi:hypothetical protein
MEMYTSGVHSNSLSQKLEPTEPSFRYNNYYNQMRQTCDREINPSLIRILTGRRHIVTINCICYYIPEECPMKMISKELTFVCIAKATFGEFQVHLDDEGTYILYVLSREIIDETPSNQFFVYVLYFLI